MVVTGNSERNQDQRHFPTSLNLWVSGILVSGRYESKSFLSKVSWFLSQCIRLIVEIAASFPLLFHFFASWSAEGQSCRIWSCIGRLDCVKQSWSPKIRTPFRIQMHPRITEWKLGHWFFYCRYQRKKAIAAFVTWIIARGKLKYRSRFYLNEFPEPLYFKTQILLFLVALRKFCYWLIWKCFFADKYILNSINF